VTKHLYIVTKFTANCLNDNNANSQIKMAIKYCNNEKTYFRMAKNRNIND